MIGAGLRLAALVAFAGGVAAGAPAPTRPTQSPPRQAESPPPPETVEGGDHWRLGTPQGIVHVWRPEGYDPRSAGTVVYVHGYYASADTAWAEDRLGAQFRESGENALFIVPEAPSSAEDPVVWPSLGPLLATVASETGVGLAPGPLVVVGHSGAWRTVEVWVQQRSVAHVILLDALYGDPAPFRAWLRTAHRRAGQLIVVAADTMRKALGLVRGLYGVARMPSVPEAVAGFSRTARQARVLLLRSQYEHRDMVTEGKVIPVLLRLTTLRPSRPALAKGAGPDRGLLAARRGRHNGLAPPVRP